MTIRSTHNSLSIRGIAATTNASGTISFGSTASHFFGRQVHFSDDGNYLLISGSDLANVYATSVYCRNGTPNSWTLHWRFQPPDPVAPYVPHSVDMNAAGSTVLIGSPTRDKMYRYDRTGTSWVLTRTFLPTSLPLGYQFGDPISISGDSAYVGGGGPLGIGIDGVEVFNASNGASLGIIGSGRTNSISMDYAGTRMVRAVISPTNDVQIWLRTGTSLTLEAVLQPTSVDGNTAISSCAINTAGDCIVVGSFEALGNIGAVYVYTRSGITWTLQQRITSNTPTVGEQFGNNVDINGAGDVIGVGTFLNSTTTTGKAYQFTRFGAAWVQTASFTRTGAIGDRYGQSIAIPKTTNDYVAISDEWTNTVYVYHLVNGAWTLSP